MDPNPHPKPKPNPHPNQAGLLERDAFLRPDALNDTNHLQIFVYCNEEVTRHPPPPPPPPPPPLPTASTALAALAALAALGTPAALAAVRVPCCADALMRARSRVRRSGRACSVRAWTTWARAQAARRCRT